RFDDTDARGAWAGRGFPELAKRVRHAGGEADDRQDDHRSARTGDPPTEPTRQRRARQADDDRVDVERRLAVEAVWLAHAAHARADPRREAEHHHARRHRDERGDDCNSASHSRIRSEIAEDVKEALRTHEVRTRLTPGVELAVDRLQSLPI